MTSSCTNQVSMEECFLTLKLHRIDHAMDYGKTSPVDPSSIVLEKTLRLGVDGHFKASFDSCCFSASTTWSIEDL